SSGRGGGGEREPPGRACGYALAGLCVRVQGGGRRPRLLRAARELLDTSLGGVELRPAERVELFAPLPQAARLVERRLPSFEPVDDLVELRLRLLERPLRLLGHGFTSSTRAPNPPSASVTSTCTPASTSPVDATTSPDSVRTIAYPRSSVCTGDNAASFAALFSSAARFRSTASAGANRSRSCVRSSRWRSRSTTTLARVRTRSTDRVRRSRP